MAERSQTYTIPLTPTHLTILFNLISDKVMTHPGPYDTTEYNDLTDLLETLYLNTIPLTHPNPLL